MIQVYAPTSNAEEAEVQRFYEDLQDLFRTNIQKRCPFHYGGLESKVGSQETPGVTGRFGLGVQNEAGQRLTEFCQENKLVIANTLFQQNKRRLLEENIGKTVSDKNHSRILYDPPPRVMEIKAKINKWDLNLKAFAQRRKL